MCCQYVCTCVPPFVSWFILLNELSILYRTCVLIMDISTVNERTHSFCTLGSSLWLNMLHLVSVFRWWACIDNSKTQWKAHTWQDDERWESYVEPTISNIIASQGNFCILYHLIILVSGEMSWEDSKKCVSS